MSADLRADLRADNLLALSLSSSSNQKLTKQYITNSYGTEETVKYCISTEKLFCYSLLNCVLENLY